MDMCSYALGIDLGTTSVKVSLVDVETLEIKETIVRQTKAGIESGSRKAEQCTRKIFKQLQVCLSELPQEGLANVVHISVTGQMHGIALWKRDLACEYTINKW